MNLLIQVKNCLCLEHLVLNKTCLTNDEMCLEAGNYRVFLIILLIALIVVHVYYNSRNCILMLFFLKLKNLIRMELAPHFFEHVKN